MFKRQFERKQEGITMPALSVCDLFPTKSEDTHIPPDTSTVFKIV